MPDPRHDLEGLGKKVTALSDALAKLGNGEDLKHLLQIIHRPGWTTPAEFLLVNSIVDHLAGQVGHLANLKGQLMKASEAVGRQG